MYGSEVWGKGCFDRNKLKSYKVFFTLCNDINVEMLNIKCCKYILGVPRRVTAQLYCLN